MFMVVWISRIVKDCSNITSRLTKASRKAKETSSSFSAGEVGSGSTIAKLRFRFQWDQRGVPPGPVPFLPGSTRLRLAPPAPFSQLQQHNSISMPPSQM